MFRLVDASSVAFAGQAALLGFPLLWIPACSVHRDGSVFQGTVIIGATIAVSERGLVEFGVAVLANDATQTEALDPTLATLLLSTANPRHLRWVTFIAEARLI